MRPLGEAPVLTGAGVVLRPWTEADFPRIVELFDDPDVDAWTPLPSPYTLVEARRMFDAAARRATLGQALKWAITKDGGVAFGEVLIMLGELEGPEVELGYVLGVEGRGRGLASRALLLALDYGVEVLGKHRFRLMIAVGNAASEAVALRCGFRLADLPHEWHENKNRRVELRIWERTA
jgi:RimJ/RimL family protein N-acetyltransferase